MGKHGRAFGSILAALFLAVSGPLTDFTVVLNDRIRQFWHDGHSTSDPELIRREVPRAHDALQHTCNRRSVSADISHMSDFGGTGQHPSATQRKRAIAAARAHIKSLGVHPLNADFTVSRVPNGFSVLIEFILGYDKKGASLKAPGAYCIMLLSDDLHFLDMIHGL